MKQAIIALITTTLILVMTIGAFAATNSQAQVTPAAKESLVTCTNEIVGDNVKIRCKAAGVIVLNQTVKLPNVTQTIPVPGPTQTETVTDKVTVTLPGTTETVTIPANEKTVSVTLPPETVTKTVEVAQDRSRQPGADSGTIESRPEEGGSAVFPEVRLDRVQVAALGFLTVFAMMSLVLIGMYSGYYLGYKDSDREEAQFLRSLLGR